MGLSKPRVIVTDHVYTTLEPERKILDPFNVHFKEYQCLDEEKLIDICRNATAILTTAAPITRRVIQAMEDTKVIVRHGAGYDTIDVDAATEKGIMVVNVPDFGYSEVADHAFALILSLLRRIPQYMNLVKEGSWTEWAKYSIPPLNELTLGIIGFGRVGRQVAKKARKALEMKILGYDPYVPQNIFEHEQVQQMEVDELLKEADIITIHTALTHETRHFIDRRRLKLMKNSAFLVNTSRGGVIDQEALIEALKERWIAGAALDVLTKEPTPKDNPLLSMENVIITPHVAWYSEYSCIDLLQKAALEVARTLKGELPLHIVNREQLIKKGII